MRAFNANHVTYICTTFFQTLTKRAFFVIIAVSIAFIAQPVWAQEAWETPAFVYGRCNTVYGPFGFTSPILIDTQQTYHFVGATASDIDGADIPLDLNNNGILDVVAVDRASGSIAIFIDTLANAPAVYSVEGTPSSFAAGDIDNDGDIDLISFNDQVNTTAQFTVLRNQGDGTFSNTETIFHSNSVNCPTVNQGLRGAALGDFNNDGYLDIAASYNNCISALPNTNGSFGTNWWGGIVFVILPSPTMVTLHINANLDDKLDIAITNPTSGGPFTPESVVRFRNTTTQVGGTITFYTGSNDYTQFGIDSISMVRGDFDDDQRTDLIPVKNESQTIVPLWNSDTGPQSEIFVTGSELPTGGTDYFISIASGDLDLDGKLDIITGNQADMAVSAILNNGEREFAPALLFDLERQAVSITLGDYDADGDLDVIATTVEGGLSVLRNTRRRRVCTYPVTFYDLMK